MLKQRSGDLEPVSKQLQYLYFRRSAVDRLIRSLEIYEKSMAKVSEPEREKGA
jgi:hypothetical protein